MQVTGADPRRDRLLEPGEQSRRHGIGAWALTILTGALLILFGFAVAVFGVLSGLISQGQLLAMLGEDPTASVPLVSTQQVSAPATGAESPAPTSDLPADQRTRVLRDETFGDWRLVCVEASGGTAATCSASQQLLVAESGAAVFVWRIVQDGRGGLTGIWQVPETVLLGAGLTLDAGTPQPVVMPFESCGGGRCQVVANLAPDFIETLSGTETLSASVVLTNRQTLAFPLSSNGLVGALAALSD